MSVPGKKRGPYKPRAAKSSAQTPDNLAGVPPRSHDKDEPHLDGLDLGVVAGGVSAAWLAHVFGHDKNTIKKKLAKCEIAGSNRGTPLYRIKDAAAWLVPPKVDIMTYIKGLRPNDLPPQLNDAYWSAMRKRQQVLLEAGDLWETDAVLKVFGETALKIKDTVQLWVEELDRVHGLTDEQREMLTRQADGLLEEIHDAFVTAPAKKRTFSTLVEYADTERPSAQADEVEEIDDLI